MHIAYTYFLVLQPISFTKNYLLFKKCQSLTVFLNKKTEKFVQSYTTLTLLLYFYLLCIKPNKEELKDRQQAVNTKTIVEPCRHGNKNMVSSIRIPPIRKVNFFCR